MHGNVNSLSYFQYKIFTCTHESTLSYNSQTKFLNNFSFKKISILIYFFLGETLISLPTIDKETTVQSDQVMKKSKRDTNSIDMGKKKNIALFRDLEVYA